ncbi:tRNA glutamyl-Q(34) synthetase GluQRS [Paracoccus gahaiensis]|uniref:tRNA glutamyl-Q(34) synthetase GluQRS n=1 Tax=Paracoccus gahaiensis TaxID=1706839 RepID=A0A4V5MV03_9RHOB|nr:tRNA glutamyl-Q(34) synthetase GluQRS [Paracoccus gahaiensis]TJZ89738.1 tRNA glutamyl-Q(34) synthetase GluQRS [Paracoccus gahaiensis]
MAGRAIDAGEVTRFAPSPTGLLHLGHAYSALTAAAHGAFHLRIEDIDRDRCRPEFEAAILDDLAWLGLDWPQPVMRQSDRLPAYRAALDRLAPLTYPCRCRRGDIRAALSAPQEGALPAGPDGLVYPGTCRGRSHRDAGPDDVIRLDIARAFDALGLDRIGFRDRTILPDHDHILTRDQVAQGIGDVILSRRGMGTSYHLAVVVDDAAQGITLVTRGKDLFDATYIHVLLQRLLDLPTPAYLHHRLIRDDTGRRLAKRDDARAIRHYRDEGATPADIRQMIGL